MYKRMWKANLVFTFLFLLTFSLTFGMVYYGMYLKSQIQQTGHTAEQVDYAYNNCYLVFWKDNVSNKLGIKLPELSQGVLSYDVLVHGADVVGVKSAYVVMEMYEDIMEPLEEGAYFRNAGSFKMPQCIVGDAWLKYAEKNNGMTTVCINGHDCIVSGVLKSNTFKGGDERIFLYGPSMPEEFLDGLLKMSESMSVDYRISEHADQEQIKIFEDWVHSGIFENIEENSNIYTVDGGVTTEFKEVMPVYEKFFKLMLAFCFINCAFLTYVWCTKNLQQNMVKRVFGFALPSIWLDGFKEIALYEAVSILISSIICLLIETLRGNAMNFFITWKHGVGIMAAVVLAFTFLLSMVNILYLRKLTPADTLKATE